MFKRWLRKHLRMGLVVRRTHHVIRGLEFPVPPHNLPGGDRGLEVEPITKSPMTNELIDRGYIKSPP